MADQERPGDVSQEKACKIMEDGAVNGRPLTKAQRAFFSARCAGEAPRRAEDGTWVIPRDYGLSLMGAVLDQPAG